MFLTIIGAETMLLDPNKTMKLSKLHLRAALIAEFQNMHDGGRPIADPSWFIA